MSVVNRSSDAVTAASKMQGTKHTSPLLILVEKRPKDNEIHVTHLFKDNYLALARYLAFMKERQII